MRNYKKSLLSVAAAAAIATTSLSAAYVPLTTTGSDNKWVVFGVSGLNTDGTPATESGKFSIANSNKTALIDADVDELEASGMNTSGVTGEDLVQVKALSDKNIEIRIDTTVDGTIDVAYLQSDPVRTIYVKHGSDTPNFAVSYKASLEGKRLEYKVDGSEAYFITINSDNTFNNPVQGVKVQGNPAIAGNEQNSWTEDAVHSVMDYDFADNPTFSDGWNIKTHKTDTGALGNIGSANLRVYTYDAPNAKWDIYDSRNTAGTNDFTNVVAAKAYWAKVGNANSKEAGVVLGTPSLTTVNYTNAGLTDGWNFIAFDAKNSEIRNAASGMLVTLKSGNNKTIKITDSSGNHTITVTRTADTNDQLAKDINSAVAAAKLTGNLPSTFELRAYPTNASAADGQIALIANKKFSLKEGDGDILAAATTLTGGVLLDPVTLVDTTNGGDVEGTNGVMTKYGEYAMVIEPLVNSVANTYASNMSTPAASVQILGKTHADDTAIEINVATATAVATALNGHSDITATAINLAIDGTPTEVLLASNDPFAIRDHTFTRVYKVDKTGATSGSSILDFTGGFTNTATLLYADVDDATATTNAADVAARIEAAGDASTMSAEAVTVGGAKNEVVIVSDTASSSKFLITESADANGAPQDFIQLTTGTTDLSKGAVKNVYSLNYLSKIPLATTVTISGAAGPDFPFANNPDDTIRFDIKTAYGTITGTEIHPNPTLSLDFTKSTDADNLAYFDLLRDTINADLTAQGFTATATHNYDLANTVGNSNKDEFDKSTITITGPDVQNIIAVPVDGAAIKEVFTLTIDPDVVIDSTTNDTVFTFDGNGGLNMDNGDVLAQVVAKIAGDTYTNWSVTGSDAAAGTVQFTETTAGAIADVVIGDMTFDDGTEADTDFNLGTHTITKETEGADAGGEAVLNIAPTAGDITTPSGDLSKDLKYNSILTPDYVMNGPLYTMRDNNMTLKALVTGTTDLSDGSVSWESIDLTRKPSEWLNSQDYNLFDVDAQAGYWAKLSTDTSANPISISSPKITASFQHHFDVDSSVTPNVHTTHNLFNGDIEVIVNGLSDYDSRKSSRVTATIGGETFELTKDPLDANKFNGTVNVYEANGISENKNYDVKIAVADGLGNNFSQSFSTATNDALFDNEKPSKPTVTITNGELTITSTDATVAGFYVYPSAIPEKGTAAAALATLTGAGGKASGGCETQSASKWNDPTAGITVIAVDGAGVIGKGNISDAATVQFMPIMKNRALVEDRNNAGDVTATTGGNLFDSGCSISGPIPAETGVTLTAITSDTTAKLAYTSFGANANNDTPVTVYVSDTGSAGTIAKISFPVEYSGTDVFVQIAGKVYGYQLPTKAEMDNGDPGVSSSDPVNLSTITGSQNPKDGIEL